MERQGPQRGLAATTGKPQRFARRPAAKGPRGPHGGQKGGGAPGDPRGGKKGGGAPAGAFVRKRRRVEDEEIDSDSASGSEDVSFSTDGEAEEDNETTDEARLRTAREYLKQVASAAKGSRMTKTKYLTLGTHATDREMEADTAFDSEENSQSDDDEEEDEEEDDLFLDAKTKAAAADELKRKVQARKILTRQPSSIAQKVSFGNAVFLRGHKLPVTCVALPGGFGHGDTPNCSSSSSSSSSSSRHAYTGGKDCCILRWDLETGKKDVFKGKRNWFAAEEGVKCNNTGGHFRPVLDLSVAADERIFFSAGADHTVRAWDPRSSNTKCLFELRGHRGPVTGIRFNGSSEGRNAYGDVELITCSSDKSLKTWSVSCRSVANHFYGHASEVNCLDLLQADKPITGGSDGTLRNWKLAQDTHAAFAPLGSCVDSVAMLSPSVFACGTQGGLLALFNSSCKKPLACVRVNSQNKNIKAAKTDQISVASLRATGAASSVSALAALPMTDALLVGTESGKVQIWQAAQTDRKAGGGYLKAMPAACVEAEGAVTGLCVSADRSFAVAAVATESRLGRWFKAEEGKNGILVLPLISDQA